jgi:23S rRNA (cytosine1962-C5)-methyltransferase
MNGPPDEKFRDPAVVDFGVDEAGAGRRLERLGGVLVDRPLPQTRMARGQPRLWEQVHARYVDDADARHSPRSGRWVLDGNPPTPWQVHVPLGATTLALEVRPAPSGQIGVFIEQFEQWQWLARTTPRSALMLSLFGHSGGATLALAAAGAEVVHVDASRQAIALARRNAAASGLADLPIHWVCEDAATFVARQCRRGSRFSGAVLDPPSWGHGPKGQAFSIDRDLEPLVDQTVQLLAADVNRPGGPVLLTSHSPGWHHERLRGTLLSASRTAGLDCEGLDSGVLACSDDAGRRLPLGDFARWARAT